MNTCAIEPGMVMMHPGLSPVWIALAMLSMAVVAAWAVAATTAMPSYTGRSSDLRTLPGIGPLVRWVLSDPLALDVIKAVAVAAFLLIVAAGLWGTPIPERNLATVMAWTIWWTAAVAATFAFGPVWCAVCPWQTLAGWLARIRLDLPVPSWLRSLWPALILLAGLTWLELGLGLSSSPAGTALLGLGLVAAATIALILFERRAFCRYWCPIGRTLGTYGHLAPVALRGADPARCNTCQTMECYRGGAAAEPCPSGLVVGRMTDTTYCLSCGACAANCSSNNVTWGLRRPWDHGRVGTRAHWGETAFLIGLLGVTFFHGLTMIPDWEPAIRWLARVLGDGARPLVSFTLALVTTVAIPALLYAGAILVTATVTRQPFRRLFSGLCATLAPIALAYHLAHNLGHFSSNAHGFLRVLLDPLGWNAQPLSELERHVRIIEPVIPEMLQAALQSGLAVLGFWLAVQILRHQGRDLLRTRLSRLPMVAFLASMTGAGLWMMGQTMVMPG